MKNKIFIESLRCVLCGTSSLQEENDFLFCNNIDCTRSKNPYRYLLSKPLLVDFNESVLVEDNFHNKEGVSDVKRTPIGMLTDFRNLFRKKNHIAKYSLGMKFFLLQLVFVYYCNLSSKQFKKKICIFLITKR